MKTIQSYLRAFVFCFLFCFFQYACSRDGGVLHVVPNKVTLSGESQSFTVTTKERQPYYIYNIHIGETRYDYYEEALLADVNIQGECRLDYEWLHWQHHTGDEFATVSVDENNSGVVRKALINIYGSDIWGSISITQLP